MTRSESLSIAPPGVAAVVGDGDDVRHRAAALANQLQRPLIDPSALAEHPPEALVLHVDRAGVCLRRVDESPSVATRVDFTTAARRVAVGVRRLPLVRAMGRDVSTIIDATAGLGEDAATLAAAGFRVTMVERHPALAAMLADGLQRLAADDAALAARLRLIAGDAAALLADADALPIDPSTAIYLDPMFEPRRRRSAKPRKAMQRLQQLLADDAEPTADAAGLLAAARSRAARVVVKRADDLPPIARDTTFSVGSKLVRFDVYVNGRAAAEGTP